MGDEQARSNRPSMNADELRLDGSTGLALPLDKRASVQTVVVDIVAGVSMPTASPQSLGYLPVATATLFPAAVLDCDLYIQRRGCSFAELYRARTYPLQLEDIQRLSEEGVDQLYIRIEDADSYRAYLCQNVLGDRKIPFATRLKAVQEVTRVAFENAFALRESHKIVN